MRQALFIMEKGKKAAENEMNKATKNKRTREIVFVYEMYGFG